MGGAAAIGTTPDLTAVLDPAIAGGDSDALLLGARETTALREACCMEFFRDVFLEEREEPTAKVLALLRLRFLITSVFKERGRTTPWSFRNRPQALHRG